METIDLRSDTVTLPSKEMLDYMMNARVGDMVLGEDPSVNDLEKRVAHLFGMDDAAFCPSGTMTNQIAVNVHTRPGDEVICSGLSHIYLYEGGGIAFNSGSSVSLIDSDDGTFSAEQVKSHINADDHHKAHSSLVCVENTVNMGGGKIWNLNELKRIKEVCTGNSLGYHLDGARLFNALVESDADPKEFGSLFDSISICLSKGLGAPVGSVLTGSESFIKKARRTRKVLGGTMRQAGFLAAAGLYALDNNIVRLKDDHLNSKAIASVLKDCPWIRSVVPPETNIIIFEVACDINPKEIFQKLSEKGILVSIINNRLMRMVTHLNITSSMTERVCKTLPRLM